MCDVCLDSGTVDLIALVLYAAIFGAVSMIIALAGRPWIGLILTPLAFLGVHLVGGLPADFPGTVLPGLLLTLGLRQFGCVPGTHVLRRRMRIITFAVGVLSLVPFLFLITGH